MFVNIILFLHGWNIFLILAAGLVSGIWGFVLYFRKAQAIPPSWRSALIVTVILALLQGVFGIIMLLAGLKPGNPSDSLYYLHYVYGAIVALAIPVAVTYATGGKNIRRDILIFSIAAIIIFAAGFRAWMTGPTSWPWIPY
jgi:heme A synthase